MSNLISAAQLSVKLSISIPTIHRWRKLGLPSIKFGKSVRFDYEKVIKWIEDSEKNGSKNG